MRGLVLRVRVRVRQAPEGLPLWGEGIWGFGVLNLRTPMTFHCLWISLSICILLPWVSGYTFVGLMMTDTVLVISLEVEVQLKHQMPIRLCGAFFMCNHLTHSSLASMTLMAGEEANLWPLSLETIDDKDKWTMWHHSRVPAWWDQMVDESIDGSPVSGPCLMKTWLATQRSIMLKDNVCKTVSNHLLSRQSFLLWLPQVGRTGNGAFIFSLGRAQGG